MYKKEKEEENVSKILVEFINTWPSCDCYSEFVKKISHKHEKIINCKIYNAGKDLSYIKKYGPVMKGTLIINERKKIDRLSKTIIEKAIEEAIKEMWLWKF